MNRNPEQLVLPVIRDGFPGVGEEPLNKSPLPMQYLGAKTRIAGQLLDSILQECPGTEVFVDLFAGTGAVSLAADRSGYRVVANDLQYYSYVVLSSLLLLPRAGLLALASALPLLKRDDSLLAAGRTAFKEELQVEREFRRALARENLDWTQYKTFSESTLLVAGDPDEVAVLRQQNAWNLFCHYYRNTYFGVEQCLQLDTMRQWAESLQPDCKTHILACIVSAMTHAVSGTTHLAQYSTVRSKKSAHTILRKRSIDLIESVRDRLLALSRSSTNQPAIAVYNEDFRIALEEIRLTERSVVYVDPPYFKEHYSRYYHVLDTLALYDYPELTQNPRRGGTTAGRYRVGRLASDFGKRSTVRAAFGDLLTACRRDRAKVAISYADTSLLQPEELLEICRATSWRPKVFEFQLMHSGQGQPRNRDVTEQLFVLHPVD